MTQPWPARRASVGPQLTRPEPANLADLLERVLDMGIVVAGDIRIDLLDIELLTIRIRLLIASVDRAREMGIDWWEHDPMLSSGVRDRADGHKRLPRRGEQHPQEREKAPAQRQRPPAGRRPLAERQTPPAERQVKPQLKRSRMNSHD